MGNNSLRNIDSPFANKSKIDNESVNLVFNYSIVTTMLITPLHLPLTGFKEFDERTTTITTRLVKYNYQIDIPLHY